MKMTFVAATVVLVASSFGSVSYADGWLAETFVKPFDPGLARDLDQLNANLGNPVDHAAAAGAEAIIPGAGTAMELNWGMNQIQNGQGGFGPAQVPPQVLLGNRCLTPFGVSGFGPLNPVGSFCTMGQYSGVVVQ